MLGLFTKPTPDRVFEAMIAGKTVQVDRLTGAELTQVFDRLERFWADSLTKVDALEAEARERMKQAQELRRQAQRALNEVRKARRRIKESGAF